MEVNCTVLEVAGVEDEDALALGVQLHVPDPAGRLRLRTPHPDWLLSHNLYMPNLQNQTNVRVIFGFGLQTSDAAVKIRQDLFPHALCYIVNIWPFDSLKPQILGIKKMEVFWRFQLLKEDMKEADAIFSIGYNCYEFYRNMFVNYDELTQKHHQLTPIPYERYFGEALDEHRSVFESKEFHIVSLFEEHFIDDAKTYKPIASMLHSLGESLKVDITWKIMGFPNGKERLFMEVLDPEVRAIVQPVPPLSVYEYDDMVQRAQLILIPPSAINSRNLALTAMALAIPIIVPVESDIHVLLDQHTRHIEKFMVSDMEDMQVLKFKIREVIVRPELALHRAIEVKRHLQITAAIAERDMNVGFRYIIRPDRFGGPGLSQSESFSMSRNLVDPFNNRRFLHHLKRIREVYEATVFVSIKGGIPEPTTNMATIRETLFGMDRPEFELSMNKVADLHPQLKAKYFDRRNNRFVLECKTIEALCGLWKAYEQQILLDIMQSTLLTCEIVEEIQARHLRLHVNLDYEEYEAGKRELRFEKDARDKKMTRRVSESDISKLSLPEGDRHFYAQRQKRIEEEARKKTLTKCKSLQELYLYSSNRDKTLTFVQELEKMPHPIPSDKNNVYDEVKVALIMHNRTLYKRVTDLKMEETELIAEGPPPRIGCRKFGEEGSEINQVNGPSGITVNHNNELVFADYNNHRLQILNQEYQCRHVIALEGFPQPFKPRDVTVSADGRYFVSDEGNKQIVVCTEDNKVLATFGQKEGLSPHGLALTRDGHLLVTDQDKNCISRYTLDGTHVADIGSTGTGPGQFKSPMSVAVNSRNQMIVSDSDNRRVQMLNMNGGFIGFVGPDGTGASASRPPSPYGLNVDQHDNIYVCDVNANIVANYTPAGKFIENLGRAQLRKPSFVATRNENRGTPTMVVTEFEQNNFKVVLL
ncbi:uncharacterized protein LOC144444893 [Glandiceps talaboti]